MTSPLLLPQLMLILQAEQALARPPQLSDPRAKTWVFEKVQYLGGAVGVRGKSETWDNSLTVSPDVIRLDLKSGQIIEVDPERVTAVNHRGGPYFRIHYNTRDGRGSALLLRLHQGNESAVLESLRSVTKALAFTPMPSEATGARALVLDGVAGLAVDAGGSIYASEMTKHRIVKVSPSGELAVVAGTGKRGYSGDGGPAKVAELDTPAGLALDTDGNLYLVDRHRIRKLDANGNISTVAGNGRKGSSGDGGRATVAEVDPSAVAVVQGNVYIADGPKIRRVNADGVISTVASLGSKTMGLTVDSAGNLYVAAAMARVVQKLNPSGVVTTVAGTGRFGGGGDGGMATAAELSNPLGVTVDGTGNLYIADQNNQRIRMVAPDNRIDTVVGDSIFTIARQDTPLLVYSPTGMTVDAAGNLYFSSGALPRQPGDAGAGLGTVGLLADVVSNVARGLAWFRVDDRTVASTDKNHNTWIFKRSSDGSVSRIGLR